MSMERCFNQNHSKMNVTVRYCLDCGEIVNQKVQKTRCDNIQHARKRKDRDLFCTNCGENLRSSN